MKNTHTLVIALFVLLIFGCTNKQPIPENPITITAIPDSTIKVTGKWKM